MSNLFFKIKVLRVYLVEAVQQWKEDIWDRDPDQYHCCDGRECGCEGKTIIEVWSGDL